MAHDEPSHQGLHCFSVCYDFSPRSLLRTNVLSKSKNGKIHIRLRGESATCTCNTFLNSWSINFVKGQGKLILDNTDAQVNKDLRSLHILPQTIFV